MRSLLKRLEEWLAVLAGDAGRWSEVKIHFWKFLKDLFIQNKIITRSQDFIYILKNEIGGYFKNVQRVNLLSNELGSHNNNLVC